MHLIFQINTHIKCYFPKESTAGHLNTIFDVNVGFLFIAEPLGLVTNNIFVLPQGCNLGAEQKEGKVDPLKNKASTDEDKSHPPFLSEALKFNSNVTKVRME